MFEHTFTFWRRWIGASPAPAESAVVIEDERRLWVRHATELQGQVQAADGPADERLLAAVRDLSRGGANLIVDKPFREGEMVTVELPGANDEIRTILACVVRVVAQAQQWSLGCVFARELDEEDLAVLGAQKLPATDADQRVWVRFSCEVRASCRKFGDSEDDSHPAQVLNISATGIGLVVPPPLVAGTLLNVDLFEKSGRRVCSILACIVHTTQRTDGHHSVGCNFIRELNEAELESLL
jgi:hypothetical protein